MKKSILRNAPKEELIEAITGNYIDSWQDLARAFNQPDPRELFGINGFIFGIPYMMMNSLFDGPQEMEVDKVTKILEWFKQHHVPMMWFVTPSGQTARIDTLLDQLEIELATMQVPGMAIDLLNLEKEELISRKEKYSIVIVDNPEQAKIYTQLFMKGFNIDPTIKGPMEQFSTEFLKYPAARHFLVKMGDLFVGCASVVYAAGVAGIYNVVTLPDYRGQGIAGAAMAACLLDAMQEDYQYSILHSSTMGHPLYEKLGYKDYFVFKRYLLRPADVGL